MNLGGMGKLNLKVENVIYVIILTENKPLCYKHKFLHIKKFTI